MSLEQRVEEALGVGVVSRSGMSGGCVGEVYAIRLADDRDVVVKVDSSRQPKLDIEGYMLEYLADRSNLPVPTVFHTAPDLLVMEKLPGRSQFSGSAEQHAAELLAELHGIRNARFGLSKDTLIGGLHQPNTPSDSWIAFFRDERLFHMARLAHQEGQMGETMLSRLEQFSQSLERYLEEPEYPALIHGDVWTTNVLADGGRITGFIDPAIYYAHPEIELAFITLFGTFGESFFAKYSELRGIRSGFFEVRRDIYNLYPLLVHVRLFGSSYLSGVERVLRTHGF